MRVVTPIVVSAFLAGFLALAMLGIALSTGVAQEYFEAIHSVPEYSRRLLLEAGTLRLVFTLDNFFLVAYSVFFILFAAERRDAAPGRLLAVMLVFTLVPAVLDSLENLHILGMLSSVEQRLPISFTDIQLQALASGAKFHLSYIGAVVLAVVYPRDTLLERAVALCIGVVYPILGLAIFTAPSAWVFPLVLGRVLFFAFGYLLSGLVFALRAARTASPTSPRGG